MFETILKIILTAVILYLTVNTFLKHLVSIDRIVMLTCGFLIILIILYYDTSKTFEYFLTSGIVLLIGVVLKVISIKKQRHGYFLFNVYNKNYLEVKELLHLHSDKLGIKKNKINYQMCKPWLVIIKDTPNRITNKLFKEFDKEYAKTHKKVSMYNYWYVVAALILLAALWRF